MRSDKRLVFDDPLACLVAKLSVMRFLSLNQRLPARRWLTHWPSGGARRPASEYSHEFFVLPVYRDTTFYSFENARPCAMIASLVVE